ncbi:unnamed protein product [Pleuronectes platessa]|uniref:Uncharacterized protein n=1 Tax=Pleuronectes platessa TaxID=8262 RepID=A0A9N7YB97_PLEPL|nr:unnamed protein product [Pleuronectes platessa]
MRKGPVPASASLEQKFFLSFNPVISPCGGAGCGGGGGGTPQRGTPLLPPKRDAAPSSSPSPSSPYGCELVQMLVDGGSAGSTERTAGQMAGLRGRAGCALAGPHPHNPSSSSSSSSSTSSSSSSSSSPSPLLLPFSLYYSPSSCHARDSDFHGGGTNDFCLLSSPLLPHSVGQARRSSKEFCLPQVSITPNKSCFLLCSSAGSLVRYSERDDGGQMCRRIEARSPSAAGQCENQPGENMCAAAGSTITSTD